MSIINFFWQVLVPELQAQHGSRKKLFLRESKGKPERALQTAKREDGREGVIWMKDI